MHQHLHCNELVLDVWFTGYYVEIAGLGCQHTELRLRWKFILMSFCFVSRIVSFVTHVVRYQYLPHFNNCMACRFIIIAFFHWGTQNTFGSKSVASSCKRSGGCTPGLEVHKAHNSFLGWMCHRTKSSLKQCAIILVLPSLKAAVLQTWEKWSTINQGDALTTEMSSWTCSITWSRGTQLPKTDTFTSERKFWIHPCAIRPSYPSWCGLPSRWHKLTRAREFGQFRRTSN